MLGDGLVWVADNVNSTVSSFDPQSREMEGEPIAVGALPRSLAFGLGYVWVANGEDGTVDRIDPEAGEVVGDPIAVGSQPASIAVGPESVWTADFGDSTVTELRPGWVAHPIQIPRKSGVPGGRPSPSALLALCFQADRLPRQSLKRASEPL